MIRIEGLRKRFGRFTAVDGVALSVDAGDSLALWGVNGAGKTTVIRCILGLHRFKGRITVGGIDVARRGKAARRLIGYVPQELGFYDDLRVAEAVRFFARLKQTRPGSVDHVLHGVGLEGHAGKRIRELSGGMKQRLALSIALLGDPPVLILDEVTASLDACGRADFIGMLRHKAGLSGPRDGPAGAPRTIVFASHREDEIHAMARRVVVMDRGRIVRELPAEGFSADLAAPSLVRLHIDVPDRDRAARVLRTHGYSPHLNGAGIIVPVSANRHSSVMELMSDASIVVRGLEPLAGLGGPATPTGGLP